MDVLTVKNLINSYAGRGEPFVFGLNYACTEGFFHPRPLEQTGVLWEMDGTGNASLAVMPERKGLYSNRSTSAGSSTKPPLT